MIDTYLRARISLSDPSCICQILSWSARTTGTHSCTSSCICHIFSGRTWAAYRCCWPRPLPCRALQRCYQMIQCSKQHTDVASLYYTRALTIEQACASVTPLELVIYFPAVHELQDPSSVSPAGLVKYLPGTHELQDVAACTDHSPCGHCVQSGILSCDILHLSQIWWMAAKIQQNNCLKRLHMWISTLKHAESKQYIWNWMSHSLLNKILPLCHLQHLSRIFLMDRPYMS